MIGVLVVLVLLAIAAGLAVYRWVILGVPALDVEDPDELEAAELRAAGRGPRQWPKLVGRDW